MMTYTPNTVYRDYEVDGVSASGNHKPLKANIRGLLNQMLVSASLGALVYGTKSAMDANTTAEDAQMAWVTGDSTAANNGIYAWDDDGEEWVKTRGLPDTAAVLTNIGGTANAITADTETGVDPAEVQMLILPDPPGTNTSTTVTITLNSGSAESIKAASGGNVAIGDIIDGVGTVFFRFGSEWRQLVSSQTGATFDHQGVYDSGTTYIEGQVVTGSDDKWYQLKVASATGDDPVSGGSGDWLKILDVSGNLSVSLDDEDAVTVPLQDRFSRLVTVEDFGATSYTDTELVTLNGAASVDAVASTNATAFQNALDYVADTGGGFVWALGHIYVLDEAIEIPPGVTLFMAKPGAWDCVFHNRPKTWEGTTLLFKGTLTRDQSFHGVTSMAVAGGWREDPDNAAEYFKLTSFMDDDASGATRATARTFSAAVRGKDPQSPTPWHIQGGRICSWVGTDGISDYSDQGTSEYGDDQDIGVMVLDTDRVTIRDCQTVGYWRIAGMALLNPGHDEYAQMERLLIENCLIQGRCGLLIRGNDTHLIESSTSNSVTIPWTNEHFWESSGSFEGGSLADYTYSGLSYSATGGGQLTFTGVSPDPSAETQIHSLKRGSGVAGTCVRDTHVHSFCHVSGDDYQTVTGSSDHDRAIEISGYPMRGLHFYNVKAQVYGPICVFWHDCEDMRWIGGQLETATSTAGHIIASPVEGDASGVAHAAGQTRDMVWVAVNLSHVSEDLFTPGSLLDPMRTQFKPYADMHTRLRPRSDDLHVYIENADGDVILSSQQYTWTPVFNFGTSITYTNQEGVFQRIANWVHFTIDMSWSALGTGDTSSIQIELPVSGQDQDAAIIGSVNARLSTGLDLSTTGAVYLDAFGTDQVGLTDYSGTRLAYDSGEIQSSGRLVITGCYKLLTS